MPKGQTDEVIPQERSHPLGSSWQPKLSTTNTKSLCGINNNESMKSTGDPPNVAVFQVFWQQTTVFTIDFLYIAGVDL